MTERRKPSLFVRALHLWFLLSRGLTLGVRGAVIDAEGRVLLIRHTYVKGWHLPGGGVERGETALDALTRELAEEANVEMTGPPILHGIAHNGHVSRRDHVLVYEVRAFRQSAPKQPDREIAEAAFFPLDALPEGTTAGTRARLAEIEAGRATAARW
ncbi:NUDIX domain-containing protein [Enterovirga rhinocerotis]|uniref:ADP-ribose pyrophosphatase YjhB (NUDIX family) n=1 Tax=Enterovirga rhinocerotis TaxID=1339210 RepID=A0A4R7BT62_9HYPH|nr:NUDIX domain-containing protein [Enterovirga rhinocerotis]TDR87297.1 ADP-ribose pyrophosphatase YjhB (NUDIX family) [Enterovirga rhinocerotis]